MRFSQRRKIGIYSGLVNPHCLQGLMLSGKSMGWGHAFKKKNQEGSLDYRIESLNFCIEKWQGFDWAVTTPAYFV